MSHRFLTLTGVLMVLIAVALLKPLPAAGQSSPAVPRTADGRPDLQGTWDFRTITPLQRPRELGTKEFFTDKEAAEYEKGENLRQNRDLVDPEKGGGLYPPGGVVPYNEFWYDRGTKIVGTRRTSLIVDPPDGRLPAWTPEGQKRADLRAVQQRDDQLGHPHADSWEERSLQERCLLGQNAGPPMVPGPYNNNVQLVQTPEYVVIHNEMIHEARIIPLDGRPHGTVREWKGDSRGHWEADTLVIDTTNFKRGTTLEGSSANMHLIERFTRTNANTLLYEFTVDDPATWTKPWTAVVPMLKTNDPIYEYACHEGNYALAGILAGARAAEKAAEEAAGKGTK